MILRMYLAKKNMTICEFARRTGVSRNHMSLVSLGRAKPSSTLARIIEIETEGEVSREEADMTSKVKPWEA